MAGRPRKPTKLLVLKGTATKARHGSVEQHFELPPGCPAAPEWLSATGKEEWARIVTQPEYQQILSQLDGAALLAHCVAYANVADKSKAGEDVKAFDISALLSTIQRLGLSPSDRARIKLPEKPKESKWAKFQAPTG